MGPDGMRMIGTLSAELEREARTTRKHLERPSPPVSWRRISWTASARVGPIFSADEFDIDPSTYRPFRAASNAALLDAFDRAVADARQAIAGATYSEANGPWRLRMRGKVWFEKPAPWHLGTLALWHFGTLELWNFGLIICMHDE